LILSALQDVVLAYLRRDVATTVPFWRMATATTADLRRRAEALGCGTVVDCESVVGGGALPAAILPSAGVAVEGDRTAALRQAAPPVLATVHRAQTVCNLRTVLDEQDEMLAASLTR
jgi:hypothetical protein